MMIEEEEEWETIETNSSLLLQSLPANSFKLNNYDGHSFNNYYFCTDSEDFYYYNGTGYRKLLFYPDKQEGSLNVFLTDIEHHTVKINVLCFMIDYYFSLETLE